MPIYNIQPTYLDTILPGVPGMPASMTGWDADTKVVETAAGIGFGLAVSQGSAAKGIILGGTAAGFRGITYKDIALIPTAALTDKYPQYSNAGVMVEGDIWVLPSEAVLVTDPVYFAGATGIFLKTAAGAQLVAGAMWIRGGDASNVAMLRLVRQM